MQSLGLQQHALRISPELFLPNFFELAGLTIERASIFVEYIEGRILLFDPCVDKSEIMRMFRIERMRVTEICGTDLGPVFRDCPI